MSCKFNLHFQQYDSRFYWSYSVKPEVKRRTTNSVNKKPRKLHVVVEMLPVALDRYWRFTEKQECGKNDKY